MRAYLVAHNPLEALEQIATGSIHLVVTDISNQDQLEPLLAELRRVTAGAGPAVVLIPEEMYAPQIAELVRRNTPEGGSVFDPFSSVGKIQRGVRTAGRAFWGVQVLEEHAEVRTPLGAALELAR